MNVEIKAKGDAITSLGGIRNLYEKETLELRKQIKHLNEDIDNYVKSAEQKEIDKKTLETKITELTNERDKKKLKIDDLKDKIKSLENNNLNAQNLISQYQGEIKKYEGQEKEKVKEIEELNNKIDDLDIQISSNQREISKLKESMARGTEIERELRQANESLEIANRELKELNQNKTEENKHIKEKVEELKENLKKIQSAKSVSDEKIKELQEQAIKPEMVSTQTQTDLSYMDIDRMEEAENCITDFFKRKMFLNDAEKKEKVGFQLNILESHIRTLQEDKDHANKRGEELKLELLKLEKLAKEGKLTENELALKVEELQEIVKKKESEFQKSLRVKEEDWQKIKDNLNEKLIKADKEGNDYKRQLEEFCENVKKLENLEKDKTEQIRVINESKGLVEVEKLKVKLLVEDLKKQISKTELTEKELTEKNEKIKEINKKMGEQSYLLSFLEIYRSMSTCWFKVSYLDNYQYNYLNKITELLKSHHRKKLFRVYIEYEHLNTFDYNNSQFKTLPGDYECNASTWNARKQAWDNMFNNYARNANKTEQRSFDISSVFSDAGVGVGNFSFFYGDWWQDFETIISKKSNPSDAYEVGFTSTPPQPSKHYRLGFMKGEKYMNRIIHKITFPVAGSDKLTNKQIKWIRNPEELFGDEIYLPSAVMRRDGIDRLNREAVFCFYSGDDFISECSRVNNNSSSWNFAYNWDYVSITSRWNNIWSNYLYNSYLANVNFNSRKLGDKNEITFDITPKTNKPF